MRHAHKRCPDYSPAQCDTSGAYLYYTAEAICKTATSEFDYDDDDEKPTGYPSGAHEGGDALAVVFQNANAEQPDDFADSHAHAANGGADASADDGPAHPNGGAHVVSDQPGRKRLLHRREVQVQHQPGEHVPGGKKDDCTVRLRDILF